nr:MAG: internal scaffolding protein [Microvirus sp.]
MSITQRKILNHTQSTPNLQQPYSPSQLNHAITFKPDSPFTKQSFKDECDINTIMSRYQSTGVLPDLEQAAPQYLDATGFDFQASMDYIANAHTLFHELPSSVRTKFGNNTASFMEFVSNPNNRSEMASMGLLRPDYAPPLGDDVSKPPEPLKTPLSSIPASDQKSA